MATILQFKEYPPKKDGEAPCSSTKRSYQSVQHRLPLCLFLLVPLAAQAQRPLGCDVSGYQPSVNWTQVTNAGMKFVWAKATEGTYYVNPYFASQESGAKAAGVYIGAYHYARPGADPNITGANSADTEAQYFWNTAGSYVKYGGSYCVPMLDWEDVTATNQLSTATMSACVNEWCNTVSNYAAAAGVVGVRPVVYTGTWYSQPNSTYSGLTTAVTNWSNWMSSYNGQNPQTGGPTTYPWPSWKIWQYDDTNTSVANWTGGDVDVFNGNLAGFVQTFVVGGNNALFLTTSPTNITVAVGANVTLAVRASGLAPLSFQWFSGGHVIPGATSSNYLITSVQLTNAGGYSVSVSNSYANISSSTVFLSVLGPQTNAPDSALAPANLVNWWPADGNGVDIYKGNNATPNNGLYYTNGEVGLSFHFDGSTSYLTPATNTTISPNWTVCLWVNRQNATASSAAMMGDSTYGIKLEQYNGTRQIGLTHSGVADYVFHCTLLQNTWTHLALAYNGSQIQLYSNGVFVTSQLYSNGVAIVTPTGFPLPRACIGGDFLANGSLTDPMQGRLDEIQTFNRALSAAEINAIYNAGSAGLVRAPEFTGVVATNGSQIQLQFRGLTGKAFNLFSSPDLMTWTLLGVIPNPTGATNYTDSVSNTRQFYRASQP